MTIFLSRRIECFYTRYTIEVICLTVIMVHSFARLIERRLTVVYDAWPTYSVRTVGCERRQRMRLNLCDEGWLWCGGMSG